MPREEGVSVLGVCVLGGYQPKSVEVSYILNGEYQKRLPHKHCRHKHCVNNDSTVGH